MPITIAPEGRELTVRKIGAKINVRRHLMELGITEGSNLILLSSSGGNVIVIVKEGRLCLDRSIAGKILVA